MKNILFTESLILINCLMKKFSLITIINIDATEYVFVDKSIAQRICNVINIKFIELVKTQMIKIYNDKKNQIIIHAIYLNMII